MRGPINKDLAINPAESLQKCLNVTHKNKHKNTFPINPNTPIPLKRQKFEKLIIAKIGRLFILYKLKHRTKII